jgi:hypothetical protein
MINLGSPLYFHLKDLLFFILIMELVLTVPSITNCPVLLAPLAPLVADKRVGPVHVCLYLAIWQSAERQGVDGAIAIRREELMRLAEMEGKTTYYRGIWRGGGISSILLRGRRGKGVG